MKPAARLQSTIEILESVLEGLRPADSLTTDYFKARRYAGSKDRRAITTLVYKILRARAKRGWICQQLDIEPTARHLVLIDCIENGLDLDDLFNGETYAPAPLSDQERDWIGVAAEMDTTDAPQWVQLEYPDWLEDGLVSSLGSDLGPVLDALNAEAPLDLRVNTLHPDAREAQSILAKQNIDTEKGQFGPNCLRSPKKVKLGGIQAYKNGLVDIQDEGSQLIAHLGDVKDCELVVDFCAGAGGKTLAMAAQMNNSGHLYALDISGKRLYKMRRRLERAGVSNVELHPIQNEQDSWLKQFESRVDRLLIDAPCSGVGAWRRHPESRWKMTPELFADLLARQERILSSAAHLVKPGGRMIYATCSLLKSENEDQVTRFLAKHTNYRIVPVGEVWSKTMNTACPFDGNFMLMRPDLHQSDGFFCAILERRP